MALYCLFLLLLFLDLASFPQGAAQKRTELACESISHCQSCAVIISDLISNGGFEEIDSVGSALNWEGEGQVLVDSLGHSMKITASPLASKCIEQLLFPVPTQTYILSFAVQCSDLTGKLSIEIEGSQIELTIPPAEGLTSRQLVFSQAQSSFKMCTLVSLTELGKSYYLDDVTIFNESVECTTCEEGYWLEGGECISCAEVHQKCEVCFNGSECEVCSEGYELTPDLLCQEETDTEGEDCFPEAWWSNAKKRKWWKWWWLRRYRWRFDSGDRYHSFD